MDGRNNDWLNAHCGHRYPLDDNATGIGDDGTKLRDNIISDLYLQWPAEYGEFAYVSGITITPTLVTVVITACDSVTAATRFIPLAAISLLKPVKESAYCPVLSLSDGVAGFIAFGDVAENFAIRMSTPQQGLLSPRVSGSYVPLPVSSIRKKGRKDGLTGVVKLAASTDIEIVEETMTIDGQTVPTIVIQLQAATVARNTLAAYVGPCGNRPESNNCDTPGIQTINGVGPDCDGNLEISFEGMLAGPYQNCGTAQAGVTLDQDIGLADICPNRSTQHFIGDDYCHPTELSSMSLSTGGGDNGDGDGNLVSESLGSINCTELPFIDDFDESLSSSWVLIQGSYQLVPADSPEEFLEAGNSFGIQQALRLSNTAVRNIMLWRDCGTGDAGNKRVTTQLQLLTGGPQQNAGVVMNYRLVNPLSDPKIRYFLAQLNQTTNRIELLSFNGATATVENSVTPALPLVLNNWYEVITEVTDNVSGKRIQVDVRDITNPDWPVVSFQIVTNRWGSSTGHYGVHALQAFANFSCWRIEDA